MNTQDWTALIAAITALVGAISGLVTLIVHIRNHQPISTNKPADSTPKVGMINPAKPPTGQ